MQGKTTRQQAKLTKEVQIFQYLMRILLVSVFRDVISPFLTGICLFLNPQDPNNFFVLTPPPKKNEDITIGLSKPKMNVS